MNYHITTQNILPKCFVIYNKHICQNLEMKTILLDDVKISVHMCMSI